MRYTINKSVVNYWPNRFHQIPPAQDRGDFTGTYVSYEQKVAGIKKRLNGPKFKEHFNQPQLFVNSLAPHEFEHLVGAFSFELSHCDDETVVQNSIKRLNDIDFNLAKVCSIYSVLI